MGSSFGDRLKQERISRGLTQAELGGELYSASYISLLENGRREPTVEIIRQLSRQLEMAPQSIEEWAHPVSAADNESLIASLYARQCWDTRDYAAASENAGIAAQKAYDCRDWVTWWNMTFLQANSFLRNSRCQESFDVLERLIDHPMTVSSPALLMRTHQIVGAALLGLGHLPEAIEKTTVAVEIGSTAETEEIYATYLTSLQTLIGALAEAGRLEDAWSHCLTLNGAITETTPVQLAGEMHWVIGNVAFMRQDVSGGLNHHGKAGRLLSPALDLSRWAQFNMATAWVRLAAGIIEPATLQAIERSELAHSVVGATPVEKAEMSLLRARWFFLTNELTKALELLDSLDPDRDGLASYLAGEIALHRGKILASQGQPVEALAAFKQALDLANQAGANERANEATQEINKLSVAAHEKVS